MKFGSKDKFRSKNFRSRNFGSKIFEEKKGYKIKSKKIGPKNFDPKKFCIQNMIGFLLFHWKTNSTPNPTSLS